MQDWQKTNNRQVEEGPTAGRWARKQFQDFPFFCIKMEVTKMTSDLDVKHIVVDMILAIGGQILGARLGLHR